MRIANRWESYELIDTANKQRLERWNNRYFVRPDPQILWNKSSSPLWKKADAIYHRSKDGGGHWEYLNKEIGEMIVSYDSLRFKVKPTNFKHMGLFPEQAVNWDFLTRAIQKSERPLQVLNLFAYTGGATLACANAGASVCHVDAAKGMVNWARENAELSSLSDKPIRWIVDDCEKFIQREARRNRKYDGIILDPPSYGRGPGGEVWKLEQKIYDFLLLLTQILSDSPAFILLNSYTTGLSASVMLYLIQTVFGSRFSFFAADEIGLPVSQSDLILPSGTTAIALRKDLVQCLKNN